MFIAQLLCCMVLLIVPALMLLLGKRFSQAASSMGSKQGFYCPSALRSQEVWTFSQNTAGRFFSIGSIVLVILSIVLIFTVTAENLKSLLFFTTIVAGLQIVILVFVMAAIEMCV